MMQSFTVTNPYNNEVIGEYNYSSLSQVEESLALLKEGRAIQNNLAAFERADILKKLAGLLDSHREKFAQMITQEVGKTIADSRVEMVRAINACSASSEESRKIEGESLDSDAYSPKRERIGIIQWKPLGTILCITPFNFPINIALHKIGPAFAAGNTILLKPSPQNYASTKLLVDLCYQAGMAKEVIQLCIPDVPDMASIVQHPVVSAINFTGGTAAANAIAGVSGYKKLLFELGGNDPLIVMPDADISAAATATINHRLASAGQRCTAAKRLFIHDTIYSAFMDELLTQISQLNIGDPSLETTFVGPVINNNSALEIMRFIKQATDEGATISVGGVCDGNIVHPTVLENVSDTSILMREEVFGPVIPVKSFQSIEDIIPIINNAPYGLQAGLFTQNLAVIKTLYNRLEVGTLAVNDGPGFRAEHFPFGGVKESGVGKEGIKYAIREMSYQKTLVI